MKKGDIVTVRDFSYSVIVEGGKLRKSTFHAFYPAARKRFTVVETNCIFPRTSTRPGANHNNTVIQVVNSTEVVFIEERFLRLATYEIIIDGKIIKLSHESYKNLKRQLTQ